MLEAAGVDPAEAAMLGQRSAEETGMPEATFVDAAEAAVLGQRSAEEETGMPGATVAAKPRTPWFLADGAPPIIAHSPGRRPSTQSANEGQPPDHTSAAQAAGYPSESDLAAVPEDSFDEDPDAHGRGDAERFNV